MGYAASKQARKGGYMSDNRIQTVLITGSSSAIGKATARYFQKMGWNVAATMRKPGLETELNELEHVRLYRLDVCDQTTIDQAVPAAMHDFGTIDVLVNNAGCMGVGPFEAASQEQIRKIFDTNVFGLMNVTRAILPHFRNKRNGVIVNISSIGGRMTGPLQQIYHATKYAIEGFSDSLQFELEPYHIRIKLVEPDFTKTNLWGDKRLHFMSQSSDIYDTYSTNIIPQCLEKIEHGSSPDDVARVIYKAALDSSRKMRYPAGKSASSVLLLKAILPDALVRALVSRTFKIPKEVEIGKVLRQEAHSQEWAGKERRRMERGKVDIPCDVEGMSHGKESHAEAHVANLSREGMFVEAATPLDEGTEATIKAIQFGDTFWVKGKVVRSTAKGTAIRFGENVSREIENILNSRQK